MRDIKSSSGGPNMRTYILLLLLSTGIAFSAKVETQKVEYKIGDQKFSGFLAKPKSKKKHPAVIIVHEWWGHNEYVQERAKMLAKKGYVAFSLDMYGDGKVADHPEKAKEFSSKVLGQMDEAEKRFLKAIDFVKSQKEVNPDKIGAIGYCFGGRVVLEMARKNLDLDAVASFHGLLNTNAPAKRGQIRSKVLVYHGEDDPFIKKEDLEKFRKEMESAEVDFKMISYP